MWLLRLARLAAFANSFWGLVKPGILAGWASLSRFRDQAIKISRFDCLMKKEEIKEARFFQRKKYILFDD